jgi:hypothetical protein
LPWFLLKINFSSVEYGQEGLCARHDAIRQGRKGPNTWKTARDKLSPEVFSKILCSRHGSAAVAAPGQI